MSSLPALESPAPHPQLRLLRGEGADLFAADGEVPALALAAEAGAPEARGVFLEAPPPQEEEDLDDGPAGALLRGGYLDRYPPPRRDHTAAGRCLGDVGCLVGAVWASTAGDPAPLFLHLGALAARGRRDLRANFLRGEYSLYNQYSLHSAVFAAARANALGPLAAILEFGRWAVGAGPPFEGPPPELIRFSASRAFIVAVIIGAEAWDAAKWAPVARLLIIRGGADLRMALACISPHLPQSLRGGDARVRAAWEAAEPPRWGAAEEAALDAAVAPALLELGALLAGADAGAGAGAGGPAGA